MFSFLWQMLKAAGLMVQMMSNGYVDLNTLQNVPISYPSGVNESDHHIMQKPNWVSINLSPHMDYTPTLIHAGETIKFSKN